MVLGKPKLLAIQPIKLQKLAQWRTVDESHIRSQFSKKPQSDDAIEKAVTNVMQCWNGKSSLRREAPS